MIQYCLAWDHRVPPKGQYIRTSGIASSLLFPRLWRWASMPLVGVFLLSSSNRTAAAEIDSLVGTLQIEGLRRIEARYHTGLTALLSPQVARRAPPQIRVDQREQLVPRGDVAAAPPPCATRVLRARSRAEAGRSLCGSSSRARADPLLLNSPSSAFYAACWETTR